LFFKTIFKTFDICVGLCKCTTDISWPAVGERVSLIYDGLKSRHSCLRMPEERHQYKGPWTISKN